MNWLMEWLWLPIIWLLGVEGTFAARVALLRRAAASAQPEERSVLARAAGVAACEGLILLAAFGALIPALAGLGLRQAGFASPPGVGSALLLVGGLILAAALTRVHPVRLLLLGFAGAGLAFSAGMGSPLIQGPVPAWGLFTTAAVWLFARLLPGAGLDVARRCCSFVWALAGTVMLGLGLVLPAAERSRGLSSTPLLPGPAGHLLAAGGVVLVLVLFGYLRGIKQQREVR